MAFSPDGRFEPETLAATVRRERADVVLLSQVDRGWFLGGGHDSLQIIADRLGMRAVFAPGGRPRARGRAAHPAAARQRSRPSPSRRRATARRSAWPSAITSSASSARGCSPPHVESAHAAARLASGLAWAGRPVVLAGDLGVHARERGRSPYSPTPGLVGRTRGEAPAVHLPVAEAVAAARPRVRHAEPDRHRTCWRAAEQPRPTTGRWPSPGSPTPRPLRPGGRRNPPPLPLRRHWRGRSSGLSAPPPLSAAAFFGSGLLGRASSSRCLRGGRLCGWWPSSSRRSSSPAPSSPAALRVVFFTTGPRARRSASSSARPLVA